MFASAGCASAQSEGQAELRKPEAIHSQRIARYASPVPVERLFLVWNAELSLKEGLDYVRRRLRGEAEACALCEIAYDGLSEKPGFKQCKRDIGLPFEGVMKNRLDDEQTQARWRRLSLCVGEVLRGSSEAPGPVGDRIVRGRSRSICRALAAGTRSSGRATVER